LHGATVREAVGKELIVQNQTLTKEVKNKVEEIVKRFNESVIRDPDARYVARYRGNHLYLDRYEGGRKSPICRLTYNGKMDDWDFAIYKYSDERYDPEEWLFPGGEHVDGTIEGAMKAGLEAYPP
jgi:hypothetical protein